MKQWTNIPPCRNSEVASSREDAWIETDQQKEVKNEKKVASSREDAWIETKIGGDLCGKVLVASSREDAWIETIDSLPVING